MAPVTRTHYDVLGIARDADAAAVRSAWKLHVQAWHPDRFSEQQRDEAERQTTAINEAYSTLRDSGRRAAYDCRLAADESAARPASARVQRRHEATFQTMHRAPTAPVGAPMTMPDPVPQSIGDQAAALVREAWSVVRRHPRMGAAVAAACLFVFGGSLVLQLVSGPVLPSPSATVAHASPTVTDTAQLEDLQDLAERAKVEADQADAAFAAQLREDQRLAAEQDARMAAADAAAARQARRDAARRAAHGPKPRTDAGAKPAPKPGPGQRIVRVMPKLT